MFYHVAFSEYPTCCAYEWLLFNADDSLHAQKLHINRFHVFPWSSEEGLCLSNPHSVGLLMLPPWLYPQGKKGRPGEDGSPGIKGQKVLSCILKPITWSRCWWCRFRGLRLLLRLKSPFLLGWDRAKWTSWSRRSRGEASLIVIKIKPRLTSMYRKFSI